MGPSPAKQLPHARSIISEAVARGWLTPEVAWDLAWSLCGGELSVDEALASALSAERIERLRRVVAGDELATRVLLGTRTVCLDASHAAQSRAGLDELPGLYAEPRYLALEPIGRGGGGQVVSSLDRELGRRVAVKVPHATEPGHLARFLFEARVTARLQHPNIVPVYDLGLLPDGRPFYAMRATEPRSLADVLRGEPWPLVRLLGVFTQVARALAYAHARGVLHGDVKPGNILLGDFGEVYLADWGLARVRDAEAFEPTRAPMSFEPQDVGTPGYLAPEAYSGQRVDQRVDLFALGVVLYEALTHTQPFRRDDLAQTIAAVCLDDPERPSRIASGCPLLLEDLCMALLAKDPRERPATADEVAEQVEAFLEGAKERARRREEARKLCAQADIPVQRFRELARRQQQLAGQAKALLDNIESWEPVERKQQAWEAEDRARQAEQDAARALVEAIETFTQALGYDPGCEPAHRGLAELYLSRARSAEQERRTATQIYYENLALRHDVGGHHAEALSAPASLVLTSNPAGAHAIIQRNDERNRRVVPGEERVLGTTPIEVADLAPGSYLVRLRLEGFRDVKYPISLERGVRHEATVNLYREEDIGEGFVYVPGGPAIIGGDDEAYDALPRQCVDVPDFAIAEFPVLIRDYCVFLDELEHRDPGQAARRVPLDPSQPSVAAVERGADGRWRPGSLLIEGEARNRFPPEAGHFWRVPIMLVTWFDAQAYCRWRSERDGTTLQLPTEVQWEKAARAVDGRFFPWGFRFDATFCLMRESRPYTHQPEPVGTCPADESPYGVRDMAGGYREWIADVHGQLTAEQCAAEPEPALDEDRAACLRTVRGGMWRGTSELCRCASRSRVFATLRGTGTSFRLAKRLRTARTRGPERGLPPLSGQGR